MGNRPFVGDQPGTQLWLLIVVMTAVITPLIILSQCMAYWRVDVGDDQLFAYFGWRIANGATVYLDVWDNKPPGIYWINALAMLVSGGSYLGVVGACVLALVVAHAACFLAASAVYHRGPAALTTMLLACYLTHGYYTGGTDRTETFLVACELSAVALYLGGFKRDRWLTWFGAGLLCGLAFLFKQVGLAAWGCLLLHNALLTVTRELPWRSGLRRGVLLVAGAGTTVGLAAAYLALEGALGDAIFATFTFNRAYFAVGRSRFFDNIVNRYLLWAHVWPILMLPLGMALAASLHAFLWWLRPQYRPAEIEAPLRTVRPGCPRHVLLFVTWFLVAVYGSVISPHAYRHYVVPSIPPLILTAGYLINVLRAETRLLRRIQERAWVLVALMLMAYFAWDAAVTQFHEFANVWVPRVERREAAEWEIVGDAVAKLTTPDQRIQCWDYMPGVYLRARRINATRFATLEKVGQVHGGAQFVVDEVERDLQARPPAMLVMYAGEYYAMCLGRNAHNVVSPWKLADWVNTHYALADEVPMFGTVFLLQRRDLIDPATEARYQGRLEQSLRAQKTTP